MGKTVIIGLGNPILSDDAVGIHVSRLLKDILKGTAHLDVTELYAGGIRLLDALAGYEEAVIIDAMVTGNFLHGEFTCFTPDEAFLTRNTLSVHDMDLSTALDMGRTIGVPLPDRIRIWGVEGKDLETFSENLTSEVADAVPLLIREVVKDLGLNGNIQRECSGILNALTEKRAHPLPIR